MDWPFVQGVSPPKASSFPRNPTWDICFGNWMYGTPVMNAFRCLFYAQVESESNVLQDGSLVDLCGATLLWRTADGLFHTPTQKHLEALRQELNAARPQCPVGLNTLAFPSMQRCSRALSSVPTQEDKQPWVYLACGHVHGYHDWGHRSERDSNAQRECPMCRTVGPYVPLWLGCEPAFYVDTGAPTYAFVPCGHVCSEKSARYWAEIPLPHGTHAFHAACPFCTTQLNLAQKWAKLIFQEPVDWECRGGGQWIIA